MKSLQRHIQQLLKWALIGITLLPMLALAHVATDIPIARQLYCYTQPDFWSGNPADKGCNELNKTSGTHPGQQWNEVAKLIKADEGYDYTNQKTVETLIPDGKLCSAANPLMEGLNTPSANWYKTPMTTKNGVAEVRIVGTAPHVSSIVKIYLSKSSYNPATMPLKWSDLELLHEETVTVARTDWGEQPPSVGGLQGYFKFNVAIPNGRTGDAVLFTRFQRIDPAGEGFYNCSDITLHNDGPTPTPEWHANGLFQPQGFTPKQGDTIHFRVLGSSKSYNETVDLQYPITNAAPTVWGPGLVQALKPYASIVQVGELKGASIVYNTTDATKNLVYLADEKSSKAMSIIPGGGPEPVNPAPPVARITGPTSLTSGQTFTFSGTSSSGSNGRLLYNWAVAGMTGPTDDATVNGKAYTVTQPTIFKARLSVRDTQNGKTNQAVFDFTVTPGGGGGEHPAYKEGTAYKAGDIVTNNGKNYQCKPHPYTAWCAGAAWAYAPGSGTAWEQAWDEVQ